MDNDSRMFTLGAILTRSGGDVLSATLRSVKLNRDGGPHTISEIPLDVDNVELRFSRDVGAGRLDLGIGYEDPALGDAGSGTHGFARWQLGF
jgi:hypothetical protein